MCGDRIKKTTGVGSVRYNGTYRANVSVASAAIWPVQMLFFFPEFYRHGPYGVRSGVRFTVREGHSVYRFSVVFGLFYPVGFQNRITVLDSDRSGVGFKASSTSFELYLVYR